MRTSILASVLLMSLPALARADWPQFAGPQRTNVSTEKGLLRSWPAEGPSVLWTLPLGEGFGGAAIRGSEVFVLDRTGLDQTATDVLRCLELTSGKELWSYSYPAPGKTGFNGSRAVPAVTEKHVFAVGPFGHFICVDRTTHQLVWEKEIKEPDAKLPPWAMAQSPLLYKNSVIVSPQGKSGGIAAYEQTTGKLLWQAAGVPSAPYCSPTLLTIGGVEQIVLVHGNGASGVDPESGKILWTYGGWKCGIPIPHATLLDGQRLLITGGYRAGTAMIQLTKDAGSFSAKELWKIPQGSQIHQPIVVGSNIYFNGNTNETQDGLVCLNATDGKICWQTGKAAKLDRGNLMLAEGLIYLLDASGTLRLVEPSAEAYKEVSSVKLLGGKDIWAPMALSDDKLVIRDQKQMKCLDIKAK